MFWRPCLCPKRLLLPAQREYIWCMSIQPQPQTPVITIPLSIISSKQINHIILFSYHSSFHQPLSQRHEDKCMRMNLPNPRFFFSIFIHSSWVTCLDYSTHLLIILPFFVECAIMYCLLHITSKRAKFTWMGISWGADTCFFALGVVYLGTSTFGFSTWVLDYTTSFRKGSAYLV